MSTRHLVVSYDVTDDRIRGRLAKALVGYMDRVQKSVFEGPVEEARLESLRRVVRDTVDQASDSVRFYVLCPRCEAATEIVGTGVHIEPDAGDIVV